MTDLHSSKCKEWKAQLSNFIDGELDDSVCQEIEKHMADCENCRVVVDTLRKTILLYRETPDETVPPDVHSRLVKVLDLEAMRKGDR